MKMMKLSIISLLLIIFSLHGECNQIFLNHLEQKQGKDLFGWFEYFALEPFGGSKAINNDVNLELKNVVDLGHLKDFFIDCYDQWKLGSREIKQEQLKRFIESEHIIEAIAKEKLPSFSAQLKRNGTNKRKLQELKESLEDAIDDLMPVFVFSLQQPQLGWKKRSPQDILENYEKIAYKEIPFNAQSFFNAYSKQRNAWQRAGELIPAKIINFLQRNDIIPRVEDSEFKARTGAITKFVNLLEELKYQSKAAASQWFKPQGTLSERQINYVNEIVNALYSLYPSIKTHAINAKIRLSESPEYKLSLLIFVQARALLMILRSYVRTVDYLIQKNQ